MIKFEKFIEQYENYRSSALFVENNYVDKSFGANIKIVGLENGGGIQDIHIRNINGTATPMFLPEIWYQKINPENYRLNNQDIELLNTFNLHIVVIIDSLNCYLTGKCKYIQIYPSYECTKRGKAIKPEKFNEFIEEVFENKPDIFEKEDNSDLITKYMNIDVDLHEYLD